MSTEYTCHLGKDDGRWTKGVAARMQVKNSMIVLQCIACTLVVLCLWSCSSAVEQPANRELNAKEGTMSLARQANTEHLEIPAIDGAAPARVETASFGLG